MGGTVAVGIRFEDGETVCQHRWTGILPHWMHHPRMFRGDPEFVRSYLASAQDKAPRPLAPEGYGLVVLDFRGGLLLSMQNYSHLGQVEAVMLVARQWIGPEDEERYALLLSEGRMSLELRLWDGRLTVAERRPIGVDDLDGLCALAYELEGWNHQLREAGKTDRRWVFGIDAAPLRVEEFGCDARGALAMKARLVEIGFDLSSAEDEWAEFVAFHSMN